MISGYVAVIKSKEGSFRVVGYSTYDTIMFRDWLAGQFLEVPSVEILKLEEVWDQHGEIREQVFGLIRQTGKRVYAIRPKKPSK